MNKFLLVIVFSFAALPWAYALDCLQGICVGNRVIDSSDYVGKVVGIDGEKQQIIYLRDGYSSKSSTSASRLSVEISSSKFPINTFVIDSSNYVGKVFAAFADGRVQYLRDGYSSKSVSKNVQPEVSELNKIKAGKVVIDSSDYVGVVSHVFADGRVQYLREGYSSKSVSKNVQSEVPELNNIKAGKVVIDSSDYVGVAKHVFADGRVQYLREGHSSKSVSKNVQPEVYEKNGIQMGMLVIDSSDYVGITVHVFADGRVQYLREGHSSKSVSKYVQPGVSELNNIKAGKVVIDSSGYVGAAKHVFADGRVQYLREGYSSKSVSKNVQPEVPELNNIKAGKVVIDSSDYVGVAKHVFADGRVQYLREGYSTKSVSKKLAYEIADNPLFNKTDLYSTSSYKVGKVIRFFSNDKKQLQTANGKTITIALYAEVSELNGIALGSEIVIPTKEVVTVKRIFENATVVFDFTQIINDEEVVSETSAKLLMDEIGEGDLQRWLLEVQNYQYLLDDSYFFDRSVNMAIVADGYDQLVEDLLAMIEKGGKYLFHDSKMQKKVVDFLSNE